MRTLSALGVGLFAVVAYSLWKAGSARQFQIQAPDPSNVLCFREASLALLRHELSEQEYFAHLLAHLQGTRHPGDSLDNTIVRRKGLRADAFANSLRDIALKSNYQVPEDISVYQRLLESCSAGNIDDMRSGLDMIQKQNDRPNILQPLAVLAARSGQLRALDFCFARGAVSDSNLDQAIFSTSNSLAKFEILWSHNWRGVQQSNEVLNGLTRNALYSHPSVFRWLIEHGPEVDIKTFKHAAYAEVPVQTMKHMVDKFGVEPLRETGSLQRASSLGFTDLVTYLCETGLDVNEIPPPDVWDIREVRPGTALYEAVIHKHFDIARVLVKHGANVDYPYRTRRAILDMARERGDDDLINHISGIKEHDWKQKRNGGKNTINP